MAKELAIITHRSVVETLSSPELLQLRKISLGTVDWGEGPKKYLSSGQTMSLEARANAEVMRDRLRGMLVGHTVDAEKHRLAVVTKLLLSYPTGGATAASAQARAEAYLMALDDIPVWSIVDAITKWHRGEFGDAYDYAWAPAPAILRRVAEKSLQPIREHLQRVVELLDARPLEDLMGDRRQKAAFEEEAAQPRREDAA